MLTQERLKEVLSYNYETGIFTRIKRTSNSVSIGDIAGWKDDYWKIKVDAKTYLAHRLAWLYVYGEWPKDVLDHIDHDTYNNKISNLRDITRTANQHNQITYHKTNSSKMMGAHYHKTKKKYQSRICVNGKTIYLGMFGTAEEANKAYISAKRKLHATCTL
jgi:hypothetical protein